MGEELELDLEEPEMEMEKPKLYMDHIVTFFLDVEISKSKFVPPIILSNSSSSLVQTIVRLCDQMNAEALFCFYYDFMFSCS